ncbi:MAG: hypothetical protein AB1324_00835 [Candidatus Micrarchaeota archaeon]
MRAQASIEFLLVFGVFLGLVAVLAGGIFAQAQDASDKAAEAGEISRAESAARAAEAALRGGVTLDIGARHSVENGRFHYQAGGKMVETGGVFIVPEDEPV